MMKKFVVALAFIVMFAAVAARAEDNKVTDVKKDSWAYDSIKKMVDKGYIALYDGGEFRGDEPLTRTVFAAAMAKLVDQLESGQFKAGGADIKEIKKINEQLNASMSDYDTKLLALDSRLKDIESGKVVIQVDLSKATVEFREKYEKLVADNEKMKQDLDALSQQLGVTNKQLASETKKRKSAITTTWIGIIAAIGAGLASN
jgi:prefoldin subunit 5